MKNVKRQFSLRFPTLMCAIALSFTVLMLFLLGLVAYWTGQHESAMIARNLQLEQARGVLLYYNEVTQMAVRLAAVDSSPRWEQQYNIFDDKLDDLVQQCIQNAPNPVVREIAIEIDNRDQTLEQLDRRAFDLIRAAKLTEAKRILNSPDYQMGQAHYTQALSKLANELKLAIEREELQAKYATLGSIAVVVCIIGLIVLVWSIIVRYLRRWSAALVRESEDSVRAERLLKEAKDSLQKQAESLELLVAERTAELEKNVKAAEAFSYSVAHDIRTPVRAMQSFASALLEDYGPVLDDTGKGYAHRIVMAGKRLDDLIGDLLQYTRIVRQDIKLGPVDLESTVSECVNDLKSELETRHADIRVKSCLPSVIGDRTLVQIVFTNLITNALKYVAPGVNPKVDIWASEEENLVKIFVKDNGIGIAPDFHEKVFRMFERLHTQDAYPGTGVGLAITQQAVERMKGKVKILFSEVGKGSCFFIELLRSH